MVLTTASMSTSIVSDSEPEEGSSSSALDFFRAGLGSGVFPEAPLSLYLEGMLV